MNEQSLIVVLQFQASPAGGTWPLALSSPAGNCQRGRPGQKPLARMGLRRGSRWTRLYSAHLEWLRGLPEEPTLNQSCRKESAGGAKRVISMCVPVFDRCPGVAPSLCPYTPVHTYQLYCGDNLLCTSLLILQLLIVHPSTPSLHYSTFPPLHLNAYALSFSTICPTYASSLTPIASLHRTAVLPLGQCQQREALILGQCCTWDPSPATCFLLLPCILPVEPKGLQLLSHNCPISFCLIGSCHY